MDAMDAGKLYALTELLGSSTDDNEEFLKLICLNSEAEAVRTSKPKIKTYVEDVVHHYSDLEFKKNFRLQRSTCYAIIEDFQSSVYFPQDETHGGSKPASAETHILSFLWFAGNKCCYRDVSSRFGIAEVTFFRTMHRVLEYLVSISPNIIRFPKTPEEKQKTASEFEEVSGFPNVIGCIDGSYIPIRTPAKKIKSTYANRHDTTSVTLQGICNAKKRFLDVFTGVPSKIHDSRVLNLSFINEDLPKLCSPEWHLLGDAAYPLREWLLTPYRDYGNLGNREKRYNYKFCATRVAIENAFGILKSRFRQLIRTDFHTVDTISQFVVACCVLHNLCIDHDDLWEEDNVDYVAEEEFGYNEDVGENNLRHLGENKRNAIRDSF